VSTKETWTVGRVLAWATDDLRARDSETPRLDAELLLAHALGVNRIGLIVDRDRPLSDEELAKYRALHKRRRAAEPVAYMLGFREFYGRPFKVDPRVLIPRPDTETLVDVALRRTRERSLSLAMLDLCTGSGCVAVTIAKERPTARVLGTDISEDALAVARENAVRLGAIPAAFFRQSDLFAAVPPDGPFALITANPPYIAQGEKLADTIVKHEPHVALFGGPDGYAVTKRIVAEAPAFLEPGGVLAMELGAGQADAVAHMLEERGFVEIERAKDYGGIERVVSGVWPGTTTS
jgi:release factor glutamine methyltransferase